MFPRRPRRRTIQIRRHARYRRMSCGIETCNCGLESCQSRVIKIWLETFTSRGPCCDKAFGRRVMRTCGRGGGRPRSRRRRRGSRRLRSSRDSTGWDGLWICCDYHGSDQTREERNHRSRPQPSKQLLHEPWPGLELCAHDRAIRVDAQEDPYAILTLGRPPISSRFWSFTRGVLEAVAATTSPQGTNEGVASLRGPDEPHPRRTEQRTPLHGRVILAT